MAGWTAFTARLNPAPLSANWISRRTRRHSTRRFRRRNNGLISTTNEANGRHERIAMKPTPRCVAAFTLLSTLLACTLSPAAAAPLADELKNSLVLHFNFDN